MKIDLTKIDRTKFMAHSHELNGEEVVLVQPMPGPQCQWTQDNKIFRSSLWNADGELISAGFPKFTNWGEKPEVFPVPTDLRGCTVMEKLDGSLLIVTRWKGNLILRTRGTVDASKLNNGCELESFKVYAKSLIENCNKNLGDTWGVSFLFEWTSPNNRIVIHYGDEPKFCLVGAVEHMGYDLYPQDALNILAEMYGLLRPTTYTFGSIKDLATTVEQWKGKEGVVVYSDYGKAIHKVKSLEYLVKHRMMDELNTLEKVIDLWLVMNRVNYNEFLAEIQNTYNFDFERMNEVRRDVSKMFDAWKEVRAILSHMERFVENLVIVMDMPRKDKAEKILSSYGKTGRSAMAFKMLDGKLLSNSDYKKLLFQILKK